jgi:hypothetical protein
LVATSVLPRRREQERRAVLAALALLTAIPLAAGAQGVYDLRGRVVDQTGRPVPYAQVEVRPVDRRVVTTADGEFSIADLDDGDVEIRVRRIGYEPATVGVHIPSYEIVVITLRALPRLLDSVRIRERASSLRYTGIVLDDSDQPVVDAEVIAAGASDKGVRTDADGHFRLDKAQKGTILLRIRKFGYAPHFGSLTIRGEREDTIRMPRHPEGLPRAWILAQSGFGRDTFAYAEMSSRMSWKLSSAHVFSREDLDSFGEQNLCHAIAKLAAMRVDDCARHRCMLIDGLKPVMQTLDQWTANEVEAVEIHARDWSGTLASRFGIVCGGSVRDRGGAVVWLRRQPDDDVRRPPGH